MNYQGIYDHIIERAKTRTLDGYKEQHHIVPRCIGGSEHSTNIVSLTAREHFLCHWLLHRIYPSISKLTYAFWMMCIAVNKNSQPRYKPSSRVYEEARISVIEQRKGKPKTKEAIQKRTESRKGYQHSEEAKQKMRVSHIGRHPSEETKQKMKQAHKGKKGTPHTDEAKQKMSEAKKKSWEIKKKSLY